MTDLTCNSTGVGGKVAEVVDCLLPANLIDESPD